MRDQDFIPKKYSGEVTEGKATWQSPSNIALVKYWGKKPGQFPANPSISFTLDSCRTTTSLEWQKKKESSGEYDFELLFENEKKESFKPKIVQFFRRIGEYVPFLKEYRFSIHTSNSFPHSSGIASSASGMSALALCLMSLEKELNPDMTGEYFLRKASFLARLGSGSACRSIEGGLVVWGTHKTESSTDLYGVPYPYEVHEIFKDYQDVILLVDQGEKKVSSTLGHNLMNDHPYAAQRFNQAHENLEKLQEIFRSGDLTAFIDVVESEALTLHAMMMTSRPYYLLMKPNTLSVINRIFEFREKTGLHPCFTLDAGANVHLLFPKEERDDIYRFIENELAQFCQEGQYIKDEVGAGAKRWE